MTAIMKKQRMFREKRIFPCSSFLGGNIVAETTRQQQSKRCPCIDKDKAKTDNESQYNVIIIFQAKINGKGKKK